MRTATSGAVVVPHDLSNASTNAAWRAAMVARDLGLPLLLLHACADRVAAQAAAPVLERLADDIRNRLGVSIELEIPLEDPLAATLRVAREASLLVIGSRRGNALRELVFGTPAERLIRMCRVPVLVVKRPVRGSYRRLLVPVALEPQARRVISAALRLARAPQLEVLHALDVRDEISMRAFDLSEAQVRQQRDRSAQRARATLEEMIGQAGATTGDALPCVGFGDAAMVVLARERAMRAELLVIGKRARSTLADFFLGSVTQRVLAATRADVLVLPQEREGRSHGFAAAPRLRADGAR
ncbi:universal stress protein [Ramlibacter sp. PS3R-8]|uniref:universal stress protein n=1 Tax=Ramlibacter sp. PS3R-8 TaxID=3133437 RepID=UPI0030B18E56